MYISCTIVDVGVYFVYVALIYNPELFGVALGILYKYGIIFGQISQFVVALSAYCIKHM